MALVHPPPFPLCFRQDYSTRWPLFDFLDDETPSQEGPHTHSPTCASYFHRLLYTLTSPLPEIVFFFFIPSFALSHLWLVFSRPLPAASPLQKIRWSVIETSSFPLRPFFTLPQRFLLAWSKSFSRCASMDVLSRLPSPSPPPPRYS